MTADASLYSTLREPVETRPRDYRDLAIETLAEETLRLEADNRTLRTSLRLALLHWHHFERQIDEEQIRRGDAPRLLPLTENQRAAILAAIWDAREALAERLAIREEHVDR